MYQYVFFHLDINGCLWKHVHFSRLAADRARRSWSAMKELVKACSSKITEQPRSVDKPCIISRTLSSVVIPLEE
jgi:hypothetical protein